MKSNHNAPDYSAFANKGNNFSVEQLMIMLDNIPLCITLLTEKCESVYCNAYTANLYKLSSKQQFFDDFYQLTPANQPNGKDSQQAFCEYILAALEKGEVHFSWLDKSITNEEIPLHISIYRLNIKDAEGNQLLLSIMQDLRPQLAGSDESTVADDYYHSRITYKALFNTVAELTEEWFWIYDVNVATIQFFGKGREILGLKAERQPFPSYVVDSGMVYPDDLKTFLQFDQNLKNGEVHPVEVRFVQPSGVYKYYRITYKTMYNKDGKPMFSIGKTYDIDKQKKLEVLSKTDLLTNCLNKITTEDIVKETLINYPTASHALFLIDVDDFKSVNDDLGHYFGDITLTEIAKNLHANFRGADIIGRIGGDEFLVFIKNISDEKIIESKAQAIAKAFSNSYSGENKDYKISGSIGVAMYPKHANSYESLYKCADKALYSSKLGGKDRYTIYSEQIADFGTKNLTEVDNANNPVNAYFDADITSLVFDLMYQADDVEGSLNTVLRLIGKHLNVDRCYIVQTFNEGKSFSITYEWVDEHGRSYFDDFQDIPIEAISEYFGELDGKSVMFNNPLDLSTDKAKKKLLDFDITNSYLLAQTKCKGHTRLVFGIDDNTENRIWSEKEINTVQYIIKLISIFLASAHNEA